MFKCTSIKSDINETSYFFGNDVSKCETVLEPLILNMKQRCYNYYTFWNVKYMFVQD